MFFIETFPYWFEYIFIQERLTKIERAFRKFDLDGDGYLSWDEFLQVTVTINKAKVSKQTTFDWIWS